MNNLTVYLLLFAFWQVLAQLALPAGADSAATTIWSEWERHYLTQAGPNRAQGALVYLQGADQAHNDFVPVTIVDLARTAQWDLLRIGGASEFVASARDAKIRVLAKAEIARLRRLGYRHIILAGQKHEAWLALADGAAGGVDTVLAFAPLSDNPARDALSETIAKSDLKRIALIEADNESVNGTAGALRSGLVRSGATFSLIRQVSFDGTPSIESGRFQRRYRDCLIDLLSVSELKPSEIICNTSAGYAVGSDIRSNKAEAALTLPFGGSALWPFVGTWAGDDARGDYVILRSVAIDGAKIRFEVSLSPGPYWARTEPPMLSMTFRPEGNGPRLIRDGENGGGYLSSPRPGLLELAVRLPGRRELQTFELKPGPTRTSTIPK